jgi:CIC family chloride channel protein
VGKIVATSLTIGIGGSGEVFAPSLFMGAMIGTAYGTVLHSMFPGVVESAGAYGLVGMGAVFAGAARAPITAVIIMFERVVGARCPAGDRRGRRQIWMGCPSRV